MGEVEKNSLIFLPGKQVKPGNSDWDLCPQPGHNRDWDLNPRSQGLKLWQKPIVFQLTSHTLF